MGRTPRFSQQTRKIGPKRRRYSLRSVATTNLDETKFLKGIEMEGCNSTKIPTSNELVSSGNSSLEDIQVAREAVVEKSSPLPSLPSTSNKSGIGKIMMRRLSRTIQVQNIQLKRDIIQIDSMRKNVEQGQESSSIMEFMEDETAGQELYKEFKSAMIQKINKIQNVEQSVNVTKIKSKLEELSKLQADYLSNERFSSNVLKRLQELNDSQKNKCQEILRIIEVLNGSLAKANDSRGVDEIRTEIENCIQGQKQEVWRAFLKKELKSVKETIARNIVLN